MKDENKHDPIEARENVQVNRLTKPPSITKETMVLLEKLNLGDEEEKV